MSNFSQQRNQMVQHQLIDRGIRDQGVIDAMRSVPRELFVLQQYKELAYRDSPLPIEEGQTISQPYIVALMAEALELKPDDRVLEVGAGSGYAAAVLSRIVARVFGIEYHERLAALARHRALELGYDNIEIMHGDGTNGWPAYAPFDAILVSAGGPDVPKNLLEQLKVGGRMLIPVGDRTHSQELLRVRCLEEHEYEEESLGRVQFVPLVGTQGWAAGETELSERGECRPVSIRKKRLSHKVDDGCEPFSDLNEADLEPLLERIGNSRVVLIGEASHGTSEFYRMRARITRELIEKRGFNIVAIEGDWPDTSMLDRYVRDWDGQSLDSPAFSRFPVWMWRNREMLDFVEWLAKHNRGKQKFEDKAGIHGLDLYSLYNSIYTVLEYLERVDPAAAQRARQRYACFSPFEKEPGVYGRAAVFGEREDCEEEAVGTLVDLLQRRMEYAKLDGESQFDSEQNARLIRDAEQYYRVMYYGSRESWNRRDKHMFETLQAVMKHRGEGARAVVWAHNSHVGDASATEMGMRGEFNIGQLSREEFGDEAYLVGFGTDRGTVAAASNWDEPMQKKRVRPSLSDSYERIFSESSHPSFLLPLRESHAHDLDLREDLLTTRLQRAIGVIYRPETERVSHYFETVLPEQFDEYIWFDESTAVEPLDADDYQNLAEDHPLKP
ncbi:MAG: protein-L-isoaspartate(D-aspartate) O-methyltransferase [Wenzhouxiangellaceae bacterium]|nr:protein-L-isoaspartate(D-aspartate) O-methyltransferase [Wenzhouxiangellaceae bacterium]